MILLGAIAFCIQGTHCRHSVGCLQCALRLELKFCVVSSQLHSLLSLLLLHLRFSSLVRSLRHFLAAWTLSTVQLQISSILQPGFGFPDLLPPSPLFLLPSRRQSTPDGKWTYIMDRSFRIMGRAETGRPIGSTRNELDPTLLSKLSA